MNYRNCRANRGDAEAQRVNFDAPTVEEESFGKSSQADGKPHCHRSLAIGDPFRNGQ